MKKVLNKILPAILLVTLATPGFAENRQGAATVSPFVGGYVLDKDQREESRPVFGLRAGYNFTENFGAEAMFGYSLTETRLPYGSRETDRYRYGVDLLYHFMPQSNLVPFVVLGGGGTNFNTPNTPSAKSHYAGLVNYGAGVKYFVTPDLALRGDVQHVLLVHDTGDNNLEYSVGLTFNFGGKRKTVAAITDTSVADTDAPKVVFTAPVNGATAVPVNQKASVAFDEDMDQDTLTSSTFTVKQGTTPVSGTVTSTGTTATFTPAHYFEKDKTYTATVTTGAKDLAGNKMAGNYQWAFTTGLAADTTAPTVTFTSPVKGATAAPVKQKINAAFSENMDPASINSATFTVKQGTTTVPGKLTSSASTVTFTPARDLEKGKQYTATVTTGAKDLAGNGLAKNYVWDFKAYAPPKVIGVLATLENSHFDFNSSEISENGKTILNANSKALKANPAMKIRIAGYTSAAGSEEYNQLLSERRAVSVKNYLVKTGGIDENRLSTIGYGEASPAKHEATPSDKYSAEAYANMRVVIEIIEE
ncbi:MAG: outer membrane beta-barrel domain-containing protein [Geobacteraceae bacterium]|nr:outer membrane beta-barrel domain-containing protein [Geobacteraceae bacterium]